MKTKERQNKNWSKLISRTDPVGIEYKEFVIRIGQEYLENKKNQSWHMKVADFIFGPVDPLGENIIKEFGKHNIEKA